MKKISGWKRIVLAICAVVVLIRIGYIANGNIVKGYYTSDTVDLTEAWTVPCSNITQTFVLNEERLYGIEFILNNIHENKVGKVVLSITSEDGVAYQADLSLEDIHNGVWKTVPVNYVLEAGKEYTVSLNAVDCTQMPEIYMTYYNCASPEVIESYTAGEIPTEQPAFRYGYLREPSALDKGINMVLWLGVLGFITAILYFFEEICSKIKGCWAGILSKGNEDAIYIISEVLLGLTLIYTSEIVFEPSTRIIFFAISICCGWKLGVRNAQVRAVVDCTWKKVCLYVLYAYSAFSLTGQRIFIYPLDENVTIQGLFVFVIAIIWFVPVINSLIYLFVKAPEYLSRKEGKKLSEPVFIGVCAAFLLLPALLNLYANNPGITSRDTYDSLVVNAHHLQGMENWHPAFYCMILRLIIGIWDSTYAVIFVQYALWTYVILEGLLYLRKKQIKDVVLLGAAFFLGTSAANFIHINTIWKDIPYALCILWILILLGKLALDYKEYKGKWFIYIELFIALLGTYFFRKNGVVTFILVAVSLAVVMWKNAKVWMTLAASFAMILVIQGPIYDYLDIQDTGKRGMYIGLSQDILGVYYAGGEISAETAEMINVMTEYNTAEYDYLPTWSYQSYDLDVDTIDFIKNYLDTFIKNPVLMIKAVAAREDAIWNIFIGEGASLRCVNYTETMDGFEAWNAYYPVREYNSFYDSMAEFTAYTASNQWISAIQWRCGVFTLLGAAAFLVMAWVKNVKKYMLMAVPILGHILGLMLSTGWSDFRYFWPLNLMNLFVLLFMPVILKKENEVK